MIIVSVKDPRSIVRNYKYLKEFEKELYIKYFPKENEREPLKNIIDRIWNNSYPKSDILLLVENDKVIAGCISDFYAKCKSIEPIYLVVDEEHRNKGLARDMIEIVFSRDGVDDMYVEADNPELVELSETSIDPKLRLNIYNKLGFDVLDINYVQPPLDKGMDFEKGLVLMCKTKNPPITKGRIKTFLTEFYDSLGCLDTDEYRELIKDL